jgi:hypothetical protein
VIETSELRNFDLKIRYVNETSSFEVQCSRRSRTDVTKKGLTGRDDFFSRWFL